MVSKFISTSFLAAALALGGTAFAGGTNDQQSQPQQQGMQQQQESSQQQAASSNVKSVRLTALDQSQIKDVQTQLKDLGFYRGNVDGILGGQTHAALVSYFQSQLSLLQQGRISDGALSGFGFGRNDIEKVRGVDQSNMNDARQNTQGQEKSGGASGTQK